MKKTFLKTIGGAALAILLLAISAQIWVSAQDINNEQTNNKHTQENSFGQNDDEKIVGTWDVQVTIRNCQTGAPIRTFPSLTTFMSGGTLIDSTSGIPQALKTPGHGVWNQEFGNYRFSVKSFSFDANGNYTGYTIIRHQVNLIFRRFARLQEVEEYESSGTAQVYAPNGNLVFNGCSTTTATRFR
jgi:hypothetical protein